MFQGPSAVGKTSLRHGLMNQPLPDKPDSTILADTQSVKYVYHWARTDSSHRYWEKVSEEGEIAEEVQLVNPLLTSTEESLVSQQPHLPTVVRRPRVAEVSDYRRRVLLELEQNRASCDGKDEVLLHLWDCGGQPVFLSALSAFLSKRTVFLLMFNASQSLDEPVKVAINKQGQRMECGVLDITVREMILKWLATIHARFGGNREAILPPYPRVILVGTHADQLAPGRPPQEKEKAADEVLEKVRSAINDKAYSNMVIDGFIVDNTTAGKGEEEDKRFGELRQRIMEFVQNHLVEETPFNWVNFRKVLQLHVSKRKPVISLEEANVYAAACFVSSEDVPCAFHFYHDLGVFLFYPHIEGLESRVILQPQWLVDRFGELLSPQKGIGYAEWWNTLLKYGILVEPLYKKVWEGLTGEGLKPQFLVNLLQYFLLAAPITTEDIHTDSGKVREYFVPLMLEHRDADQTLDRQSFAQQQPSASKRAAPIHLTFHTGYVPPGYYVRLATSLAGEKAVKVLFNRGVRHNKVSMLVWSENILTITEHLETVELHFTCQTSVQSHSQSFRESCTKFLKLLTEFMVKVREWLPGVKEQLAFLCPQCGNEAPHRAKFCYFEPEGKMGGNRHCAGMGHPFSPGHSHRLLLQPESSDLQALSTFDDEVDLSDEMQLFAENIPSSKFYSLFEELEMSPQQSVADLLCRWWEEGGDRTMLAQALRAVNLKRHADKLMSGEFSVEGQAPHHPTAAESAAPPPPSFPTIDLSLVPDGTLDCSHLCVLLTALEQVYQWFDLGLKLKVPYHTLKKIEREQSARVEDSKREMLVAWLQGQGGEPSKQFLVTSLRNIKCTMADQTRSVTMTVRPVTAAEDEAIPCNEIQRLVENIPSSKLYSLCEELQMTQKQLAGDPLCSWCKAGGDRIELAQALRAVELKDLAKKLMSGEFSAESQVCCGCVLF